MIVQNSFQPLLLPALLVAVVSYAQQPGQAPAAPEAGSVDFQIVDAITGYAIGSASVRWDMAGPSLGSELSHSGVVSQDGRFVQQLSPGEYVFEISAPGYHR